MSDDIEVEVKTDDATKPKLVAVDSIETVKLPESPRTKYVLWTGGFDSTYFVLKSLRDGHRVKPVYMKHSAGWAKSELELDAQRRIREHLGSPAKLDATELWDLDQLKAPAYGSRLMTTLDELADAVHVSRQYSALRFCRDILDWNLYPDRMLHLCIVCYDELWERMTFAAGSSTPGLGAFFKGFEMPLFQQRKIDLWEDSSPAERDVLRLTFSCENADKERRSCIERRVKFPDRCTPCKHRLAEVG